MLVAALHTTLVLSLLYKGIYSVCLLSRSCPCGSTGKSYMRCFETKFQQYSCESWANCLTCEDYNEFCVTCPPGRVGLTCKNEVEVKPELSCNFPGWVENALIEGGIKSEAELFPVGTRLKFRCKDGYKREGPKSIYCLPSLYWSEDPPVCQLVPTAPAIPDFIPSCNRPETVKYGFIENDVPKRLNYPVHTTLNFKCQEGYYLVGASFIRCLLPTVDLLGSSTKLVESGGGIWSDPPPVCISTLLTTKVKRDLRSQRADTLSATQKDCTIRITGNMSSNCTSDNDGKVSCDVTCNDKHQGRYHCFQGIGWNSTLPTCETTKELKVLPMRNRKTTCPDPGKPRNGYRRDPSGYYIPSRRIFKEADSVVFFCDNKNAAAQEASRLTCQPDGTWNGTTPTCDAIQKEAQVKPEEFCKHPGVFENGIIEDFQSGTENFPPGTYLRFICRKGYERKGPETIYCLHNFQWSDEPPVCKLISTTIMSTPPSESSCKRPEPIENGFIQNDEPKIQSFPVGSYLNFKCKEGYQLKGMAVIECLRSYDQLAYWSHGIPICKYISTTTTSVPIDDVSCKNPGMIENGVFDNYPPETVSFQAGTVLKFRCAKGYELEGSKSIYCIRSGEWSENLPTCRLLSTTQVTEVSCGHPGMVVNGTFEGMSQTTFLVGSFLTFRCRSGTRIEGERKIYCLRNGLWSASPPICKTISKTTPTRREPEKDSRSTCKYPGLIDNGVYVPNVLPSEVFTAGKQLKFKCKEGYTMIGSDNIYCGINGEWSSAPPECRRSKNTSECGRVFQDVYKSTGRQTRSDWPWTVGLSTVNENDIEKIFCGGALLNSKTVLTAAHCVTGPQNIKLHFDYRRPVSEHVRKVSKIIIHPDYDDETHANDIALIKIDRHVYYDLRTQPICLPSSTFKSSGINLIAGTTTFVAGYGLEFASNHSSTPGFKVFELPVLSEKVCEPLCHDQELVSCSPYTFCAGYLKDTKECLYGGTPIVVYQKDNLQYTLEGLVTRAESARNSWDGKCKRPESYTTFTNVTHFMPFISENLN